MPLPPGYRLVDEEGGGGLPRGYRLIDEEPRSTGLPPGFKLLDEEEEEAEEDTRSPGEKLLASLSRGLTESAAGLWDLTAGVTALPEKLLPERMRGEHPGLDFATTRAQELRSGLERKPEGAGYAAAEIAASLPLALLKYAPAGRLMRGAGMLWQAAGMGATDVASALGGGADDAEALKAGLIGTGMGAGLGAVGKFIRPIRAVGGAAVGGLAGALDTGKPEDIISGALTGGILSAALPRTKVEKRAGKTDPELKKELKRAERAAKAEQEGIKFDEPETSVQFGRPPEKLINYNKYATTEGATEVMAKTFEDVDAEVIAGVRGQKPRVPFTDWLSAKQARDPGAVAKKSREELISEWAHSKDARVTHADTQLKSLTSGLTQDDLAKNLKDANGAPARLHLADRYNATFAEAHNAAQADYDKLVAAGAPPGEIARAWDTVKAITGNRLAAVLTAAGHRTAAGRTLNAAKIVSKPLSPGEKLIIKLSRTAKTDQANLDLLAKLDWNDPKAAYEAAREMFKPTKAQYGYELWLNGLLSSPKTHIVNDASNTLTQVMSAIERPIAATAEAFRTGFGTLKPRERFYGESLADIEGLVKGVMRGVRAASASHRGEISQSKLEHVRALPQTLAGVPLPGKALEIQDEFFKAIAASREAHTLAYRKQRILGKSSVEAFRGINSTLGELNSPQMLKAMRQRVEEAKRRGILGFAGDDLDEIAQQAMKAAELQTFTTEAGSFVGGIIGLREKDPTGLLKVFLPFIQTPANIVKYAVRHTGASPELWKSLGKEGAAKSDEIAKVTMGSLVGGLVAMMAKDGLVTGSGPVDQKQKSNLMATGWQPYSVKIKDTHYSFSRLEPLATIAGLAADFVEMKDPAQQAKTIKKITQAVSDNLTNKTFLQGLENFVQLWADPDRYGEQVLKNFTGSLVPSVLAGAARASDPVIRDVQLEKVGDVRDVLAARLPGKSDTVPARRSVTGKEMTRGGTALSRLLSPVDISSERPGTEVEREFAKIGYVPGKARRNRTLTMEDGTKTKISLTDQEIAELDEADAQAAEYVRRAMETDTWRNLPEQYNPKKAKVIEDIYQRVRRPILRRITAQRMLGAPP